MTATTSVECAVEATDLSCTVLSNRIKGKQNTVIAKVTNCSPLPLLAGQTVTAGLYASAADTETIEGTTPVTIPISDLYADGRPLSKVIRLQAANLPADQQAFIKVVVGGTDKVVADVRPENNHVPVSLYATDGNVMTILGDANGDGVVNFADVLTVTSYILRCQLRRHHQRRRRCRHRGHLPEEIGDTEKKTTLAATRNAPGKLFQRR